MIHENYLRKKIVKTENVHNEHKINDGDTDSSKITHCPSSCEQPPTELQSHFIHCLVNHQTIIVGICLIL